MTDAQAPSWPEWRARLEAARVNIDACCEVNAGDLRACLSALDAATERARVVKERIGPILDKHGAWPQEVRDEVSALEDKWNIELVSGEMLERFDRLLTKAEKERDAARTRLAAVQPLVEAAERYRVLTARMPSITMQEYEGRFDAFVRAAEALPPGDDNGKS